MQRKTNTKTFFFFLLLIIVGSFAFIVSKSLTEKNIAPENSDASSTNITISELISNTQISNFSTEEYNQPKDFKGSITKLNNGVYEITNNNSHDRFEVVLNEKVENVYGLGMMEVTNSVSLPDFFDSSFSSGHYSNPELDKFEGDVARMKTPMFVIPEKNLIVAYLQPSVRQIRLTRDANSTTFVFKKHPDETSAPKGKFLVIQGDNIEDTYSKYKTYLKSSNYFFKKPHYNIFGLYWETFNEYGCNPNLDGIKGILDKYKNKGIVPSLVTMGSGYWDTEDLSGCGGNYDDNRDSTTDTLKLSGTRVGTVNDFNSYIKSLNNQGTYFMIGMRYNVFSSQTNINSFVSKFPTNLQSNIFLNNQIYNGVAPNDNVRVLNLKNDSVIEAHFNAVQSNYGKVNGFKEDEMFIHDQKTYSTLINQPNKNLENFNPSLIPNAYKKYSQLSNNDFIVIGRNDFFGVGTDAQNSQGYLSGKPATTEYDIKYLLDSTFTSIISGYPHPVLETSMLPCGKYGGGTEKESLRTAQLQTFFAVTMHSCDYTKLNDQSYSNAIDWYTKLRLRLHQYTYDNALNWYNTGIPTLVKPLILDNDWQNDNEVKKLYSKLNGGSEQQPRNEYMFGNALLVRPVMNQGDNVKVYLPKGNWRPFLKAGSSIVGPKYISYNIGNNTDYPIFMKDGEILIIGTPDDPKKLQAYVTLDSLNQSSEYKLNTVDNRPTVNNFKAIYAKKEGSKIFLIRKSDGVKVEMTLSTNGKGHYVGDVSKLMQAATPTNKPGETATPTQTIVPSSTNTPGQTATPTKIISPNVTSPNQRTNNPQIPNSGKELKVQDLDTNYVVDIRDFSLFVKFYNEGNAKIDFNKNGVYKKDIGDFIEFVEVYKDENTV